MLQMAALTRKFESHSTPSRELNSCTVVCISAANLMHVGARFTIHVCVNENILLSATVGSMVVETGWWACWSRVPKEGGGTSRSHSRRANTSAFLEFFYHASPESSLSNEASERRQTLSKNRRHHNSDLENNGSHTAKLHRHSDFAWYVGRHQNVTKILIYTSTWRLYASLCRMKTCIL